MRILLNRLLRAVLIGVFVSSLQGCTPLYVSDDSITSTPRAQSFDAAAMASQPIAVAGIIAPPGLEGFSASLSLALVAATDETRPPIQAIPPYRTLSLLNEKGLARDYADLISGYSPGGILDRQRLRRIGSRLGSRYLMLPGLAEFNQTVVDKFELLGIKALRSRITTLRLWLQLWDTETGQIVWESGGEVTAVTPLLRAKRTVPFNLIAQKLWLQMIQEGLLGGKTENRLFETEEENQRQQ